MAEFLRISVTSPKAKLRRLVANFEGLLTAKWNNQLHSEALASMTHQPQGEVVPAVTKRVLQ